MFATKHKELPMHIGSSHALASSSNAGALFPRWNQVIPRGDGVVLFWITAVCTLLAVAGAVATMKFNPDLFLMLGG